MKSFAELYAGFTRKHGRFDLKESNGSPKKGGRAYTVNGVPTKQDIENHLTGKGPGLGIVMLNDDGETVNFGAIDIDVYDLDLVKLEQDCKELPLVLVESKSKGAHLYLFCEEPLPATLVQARLAEWAAALGYGGCEIFPKQVQRLEANDVGNWINLPYFGDTRWCIKGGKRVPLNAFLEIANKSLVPREYMEKVGKPKTADFQDGPPCLQHLSINGAPEGTRNMVMSNIAVYYKAKYPDAWDDKIVEFNHTTFNPPLPNSEIQTIIGSYKKKDYYYQCSQPPLCNHCNKRACLGKKYGVGANATELPVILDGMTKMLTSPPLWYLNIDGRRVELEDIDKLASQRRFKVLCMETVHKVIPKMTERRWDAIVQDLLDTVQEIEAPDDASDSGQFTHHFEQFLETRGQDVDKDRLLAGNAWLNDAQAYFRSPDLLDYLKKQGLRVLTPQRMWGMLREELGAKKGQFHIKGKNVQYWVVDMATLTLQREEFTAPNFRDPFDG